MCNCRSAGRSLRSLITRRCLTIPRKASNLCRSDCGRLLGMRRARSWHLRPYVRKYFESRRRGYANHTGANQKRKLPRRQWTVGPRRKVFVSRCIQTGLRAHEVNQVTGTCHISNALGGKKKAASFIVAFIRRRMRHKVRRSGTSLCDDRWSMQIL